MNILYYLSVPLKTVIFCIAIYMCIRTLFKEHLLRCSNPKITEWIQVITVFFGRVACIIAAGVLIWITIPFIKDSYLLVTNRYSVTEGYIVDQYQGYRGLHEYVFVDGIDGMPLEFLLGKALDKDNKYKIKYLPNTMTGIYIKIVQE